MIHKTAVIEKNVTIGKNVKIGSFSHIGLCTPNKEPCECKYGVTILDDVLIGSHVLIEHGILRPTIVGPDTRIKNKVLISHDTHIGSGCEIRSNASCYGYVTIGNGVHVSVESVIEVNGVMEDYSYLGQCSLLRGTAKTGKVYVGIPAKILRPRDPILNRIEYLIFHKFKRYWKKLYISGKRDTYR